MCHRSNIHVLFWVLFVLSLAALAMIIASMCISWDDTTMDVTASRVITIHTYTEIWKICTLEEVKDHSLYHCDKNPDDDALYATRAMLLIGVILCAVAVVLFPLKGCCFEDKKIISYVIIVLCFASAVFLAIGAIIFSAEVSTGDLTDGLWLCISAAILIAVVGVFMVILMCCCDDRDG